MASEQMRALEVAAFTQIDDKARRGIIDGLMRVIDPEHDEKQIKASFAKLDVLKGKYGYKEKKRKKK